MEHQLYRKLYHACSAPLRGKEGVIKTLAWIEKAFVAIFVAAYVFFCAFVLLNSGLSLKNLSITILLPAVCFGTVSALRKVFCRPRPYQTTGAGIQPLIKKESEGDSFPSRHIASAFVIGTVALSQFIWVGVLCYLAGLYLAVVRFLFGLHYPTDLFAGIVFGVLFGAFAFLI
jgi:membrane-associated phospholipid phosphatase